MAFNTVGVYPRSVPVHYFGFPIECELDVIYQVTDLGYYTRDLP